MNILSLLGGPIASVAGNIINKVSEVKKRKDDQYTERLKQAGSYMGYNRTWWDSLVDGINRLVRPGFTFGTLWLFYLAVSRPAEFHASMLALASVPNPLWAILGTIVVFWFGEKKLSGLRQPKPPSAKEVDSILTNIKEIKKLEKPNTT